MRIGRLTERVIILKPTETTDNEGNVKQGWTAATTVWAEVGDASGAIVLSETGFTGEGVERSMKCWPNPEVKERCRAVYDSRIYDIVLVDKKPGEYRVMLKGTAELYEG